MSHLCPSCQMDCDCDRGLPGCEHLCVQLADAVASVHRERIGQQPAFPASYSGAKGMTLRDYFASSVLIGSCASPELMQAITRMGISVGDSSYERMASACYRLADAMLAERDK